MLTRQQACCLALEAGAGFHRPLARGAAAVGELVERIGFVQIDTISVVERAHHHILASRLSGYRKDWLARAPVFEYWAHAAAYLPWRDFRFTLARKERIRAGGHDWFRVERTQVDRVLQRIGAEGPLRARQFEAASGASGWWDWKPAKRALEYLFMAGELMVVRDGFEKVFDLAERVLPSGIDTRRPTPEEQATWYIERALDAWGIVARDEIAYLRREHVGYIDAMLAAGEEERRWQRVAVEGLPRVAYWVRCADLARSADARPAAPRRLRILSPFDPFVIHRQRLRRLFDFDLRLECYLPAARRSFGYFALPLLFGSAFVGLLDAKADRDTGTLTVRNLRLDVAAKERTRVAPALSRALTAFAGFNGVRLADDWTPCAMEQ